MAHVVKVGWDGVYTPSEIAVVREVDLFTGSETLGDS